MVAGGDRVRMMTWMLGVAFSNSATAFLVASPSLPKPWVANSIDVALPELTPPVPPLQAAARRPTHKRAAPRITTVYRNGRADRNWSHCPSSNDQLPARPGASYVQ